MNRKSKQQPTAAIDIAIRELSPDEFASETSRQSDEFRDLL